VPPARSNGIKSFLRRFFSKKRPLFMTRYAALQLAIFGFLLLLLGYFFYLVAAVHGDFAGGHFKMPDADFTNVYLAGSLARSGHLAVAYDSAAFEAAKAALLGRVPEVTDWIYPPVMLPLGALFSFVRLPVAFWCWNGFTVLVMLAVLRSAGVGAAAAALTLVSPAEYRCFGLGQFAGLLSCLMFAGLVRPKAGWLFGWLVLKPQSGLIAPVALVARGRWGALLAGGLVAAGLCLLPLLLFGPQSWWLSLGRSGPLARALLDAPFGRDYQLNGISVFWMVRSLHGGLRLAGAAQLLAAGVAMLTAWRAWRMAGVDIYAAASLSLILTSFLTPYGYSSDLVGYTLALAVLAQRRGWRVDLVDGLLWLWPGYMLIATALTGVLVTPLVLAFAAYRAWGQLTHPA